MSEERRVAVVIVLDSDEAFRKFLETASKGEPTAKSEMQNRVS